MLPKRIVFIGSSSVHGRGDSELGGFVRRFRLWFEALDPQHIVYELGILGESIEGLVQRLRAEATLRNPQLICLYPGFNDIRRQGSCDAPNLKTMEQFKASLQQLIKQASALSSVLMLSGFRFNERLVTPYPNTQHFYLIADAANYTEVLRQVCNESSVPLLDLFKLSEKVSWPQYLAPDGLHANPAGHKFIFEQLRDFLQR